LVRSKNPARVLPRFVFVLLVCLLGVAPLGAQEAIAAEKVPIPFVEWFAAGDRTDIPWSVEVGQSALTFHQRMRVTLRVVVPRSLQKTSVRRELHLITKLANSEGRWLTGEGFRRAELDKPLPRSAELVFSQTMFVRPGDYTLGILLYDRVTGQRSVTRRRLRIPSVGNDPLPDAARNLPVVEFHDVTEGLDAYFHPELTGRLHLPAQTRQRVHVEVIANLSVTHEAAGLRRYQAANLSVLLPTLRVLSHLDLPNGSLALTALDLDSRRVLFEQQNVRRMDWPALKEAVEKKQAGVVDIKDMEARRERAAFFRTFLEERLAGAAGRPPAGGDDPLRVFIVVGSGILFPSGSNLQPITPPEDCRCRVYYLQYFVGRVNFWDQLFNLMKPLRAKRFQVTTPRDMRRALANLLADLRAL
jgi:hypothetical protein